MGANLKTAIIGLGWVGKAMLSIFPDSLIYDPALGKTDELAFEADYIFICVPTPNREDGSLDTSIVEESISRCKKYNSLIVVRSTVNPGTCDKFDRMSADYTYKDVVFQPEYLILQQQQSKHPTTYRLATCPDTAGQLRSSLYKNHLIRNHEKLAPSFPLDC